MLHLLLSPIHSMDLVLIFPATVSVVTSVLLVVERNYYSRDTAPPSTIAAVVVACTTLMPNDSCIEAMLNKTNRTGYKLKL